MPRLSEGMTPWAAIIPDDPEVFLPQEKKGRVLLTYTEPGTKKCLLDK